MKPFPTNICRWLDAFNRAVDKSGKLADIRTFIQHDTLPKAGAVEAAGVRCMIADEEIDRIINSNEELNDTKEDRRKVELFLRELVEQSNGKVSQGVTKIEQELASMVV